MWKSHQICGSLNKDEKIEKITAATDFPQIFEISTNEMSTTESESFMNEISDEKFKIIPKSEWNATSPTKKLEELKLPVDKFIIAHTLTKECFNKINCSKIIREIQKNQVQNQKFADIAFNFLIGGNGEVYEGK